MTQQKIPTVPDHLPMVGGTTIHLGEFSAAHGHQYDAWLQFGGEVPNTATGASKVDGKWVKHPPRPASKHPVVTVTPASRGPLATFDAATVVDLARVAAPFKIADLWDETAVITFPPKVTERMGAAIEAAIPVSEGLFTTTWIAVTDDPEFAPF